MHWSVATGPVPAPAAARQFQPARDHTIQDAGGEAEGRRARLAGVLARRHNLLTMPSRERQRILVLGAGVFGLPAAIELARRGHAVRLVDVGPLPNPLAASNDPSRLVRPDYGSDTFYRDLMFLALPRWRAWNASWGETVFHADGLLVTTDGPFAAGGFEEASLESLEEKALGSCTDAGRPPERLSPADLERRHPAWQTKGRRQGYFNPLGGWAAAERTLVHLLAEAKAVGVEIVADRVGELLVESGRVRGAVGVGGRRHEADLTLLAAGAWTPKLLPHLAERLTITGHALLYFQLPADVAAAFRPPRFVPWTADIAHTGWYGFPALPDGRLKVGRHGPGRPMDPDEPRRTTDEDEASAREFLAANLPAAADAPLAASRLCLYCDSPDGDFLVAHDSDWPGLVVASGDSGHGFKFAPVLGAIVADVVLGRPNPWAARWTWRGGAPVRREESRWVGDEGRSVPALSTDGVIQSSSLVSPIPQRKEGP